MHTEKSALAGARTKSLLVCSAIEAELDRLLPLCGPRIDCLVCGIGNVEAAISLSRQLSVQAYDEIVFAGSCGSYGEFSGYSSVVSSEFVQKDTGVLSGRSKSPAARMVCHAPGRIGSLIARGRVTGVTNCPDSVSLDLSGADTSGLAFENLECYGLAAAAERAGRPFIALLAVTNKVGPAGSDDWRANYRQYSNRLQDELIEILRGSGDL